MCGVSHVSIQKIFYLLTKTKKLAKENTLFKFSAYFTKEKALAFSLKTQKQATTKGVGGAELPTKLMNTNKRKLYDTCPCYVNYCLNTFT